MSKFTPFIKRPSYRGGASGVSKIVRESYSGQESWWSIRKRVIERDNHCCRDCGVREDPKNGIYHDVHHIIELSQGGTTTMNNLKTQCKKCHEKKHVHLFRAGYSSKGYR